MPHLPPDTNFDLDLPPDAGFMPDVSLLFGRAPTPASAAPTSHASSLECSHGSLCLVARACLAFSHCATPRRSQVDTFASKSKFLEQSNA